jgi:hypothetical protein
MQGLADLIAHGVDLEDILLFFKHVTHNPTQIR